MSFVQETISCSIVDPENEWGQQQKREPSSLNPPPKSTNTNGRTSTPAGMNRIGETFGKTICQLRLFIVALYIMRKTRTNPSDYQQYNKSLYICKTWNSAVVKINGLQLKSAKKRVI